MRSINSIAVYCGSSNGLKSSFYEEAVRLGEFLALNKIKLIYGGGDLGIMGAVSNSVVKNNGEATGVITSYLVDKEMLNKNVENMLVVETMSERKNKMFDKADAFLILPGGIGTLEEFFEVLSWKQLSLHSKEIFIYNFEHYWDELIKLINKTIDCKFTNSNIKDDYKVIDNLNDLSKYLK